MAGTDCVEQELGAAAELLPCEVCFFFARFTLSTASSAARIMRLIQYSPAAFSFLFAAQVLACMDLRPTTNTGWRAARTSCRRGSTSEGSMLAQAGVVWDRRLFYTRGSRGFAPWCRMSWGRLWDFLSPLYKDIWHQPELRTDTSNGIVDCAFGLPDSTPFRPPETISRTFEV